MLDQVRALLPDQPVHDPSLLIALRGSWLLKRSRRVAIIYENLNRIVEDVVAEDVDAEDAVG
jgi:hypothetical protein